MNDVELTPEHKELILRRLHALAREADKAGEEGKTQLLLDARWLIRVAEEAGSQPRLRLEEFHHQARMDIVRQLMAAFLILVLFLVILVGVIMDQSGAEIAQFAAPVSGLAGIGIGWLFTGSESRGTSGG